jgi:histidinol-phosphate/aromatic aminotransferase/cobyric acid decarboxylase-like protein
LQAELARDLPSLIGHYPSGSRRQRLLAGRLLGLDPSLVAVGNGASELIGALLAALGDTARVGVVLPTFEPYRRLVPPARLAEWCAPAARNFLPEVDALLAFAGSERLDALVLTNPANPTGATLPVPALRALLEGLERSRVRLVLDESFADFVDGSDSHSMLTEDTLVRHPRLVVIKSLSKAYGVPGLRLGALASGDPLLLGSIAEQLPIWNVNALAEGFLQRVGRHEQAFRDACRRVSDERTWLEQQIEASVPFLRPLPSGANYLLCEVRGGLSARELAERLLTQAFILVKACSAKRGLEGGEYLRLAIKGRPDNQALLNGLASVPVTSSPYVGHTPA